MKVELTEKTVCAGREVELIKITEDVKETVKSSRVRMASYLSSAPIRRPE